MILEDGNIKLFLGDCLEVLSSVPDKSIDMILVDPPYGTTRCAWDEVIPFKEMWGLINRVVKDSGAVLIFSQTPFDKVLGASNLKMLRYEWIWEKTAATGHLNASKMPMKSHENILVFYKKLPSYFPQKTSGHVRKSARADRGREKSDLYGAQFGVSEYDSTERNPRSVVLFPSDKQKLNLHPNQKPVALLEYLIKTYTRKNETVLDFTMGSGSTGVACVRTGRKFIGCELDDNYFSVAAGRIFGEAFS